MVQICGRVGILRPPVGFDPSGPSKWGYLGQKSWYPQCPLFPAGVFDLPWLEKYCVFDLFVVRNEGPLMLACSNVYVSGESSIFGNAFSTAF